MSALPPEIKQAAKQAGVRKVARRTDLVEAFARGEFNGDTVDAYLNRQRDQRPHWFKNKPADAALKEHKETNPFKKANWNISAQGALVKSDPALAARLAKAAGVQVGATRPVM